VGAILFVCGAILHATPQRHRILIGVELVLTGPNINFVAFASFPDVKWPISFPEMKG